MGKWSRVYVDGSREPCDAEQNNWLDALHARYRREAIERAASEHAREDAFTFGQYFVIGMAAAFVVLVVYVATGH